MTYMMRDIKQSPLESLGWFLGGSGLAVIGIWIHNKYFGGNEALEKWKAEVKKELGIDQLKINKALFFGTSTRQCSVHVKGEVHCNDLNCSNGPLGHLLDAIKMARKTLDVAMFSFTCEHIGEAILELHRRGVRVRVVADADSAFSSTTPLHQFRDEGIHVRQRISPFHMHHKFVIVDEEIVINGSLNFTNPAVMGNWENVVITSEPEIVIPFVNEFQILWADFEPGKAIIFREKSLPVRESKFVHPLNSCDPGKRKN